MKSVKILLLLICLLTILKANAQDVDLNILSIPASIRQGETGTVQIDVCNLDGGTRVVPLNKIRPLISFPDAISGYSVIPISYSGWSVFYTTGQSIVFENTATIAPGQCSRMIVQYTGINVGGPLTVAASMLFNGPQTVGNNPYNDGSTTSIAVTQGLNTPPVITSNGGGASASISIAENTTLVTTVTASDTDTPAQTLSYSITGGADGSKFTINSTTGALNFNSAPDYEFPTDAGMNNVYDVQVTVTDNGAGNMTDVQNIAVTVTNVIENNPPVITSNGGGASATISIPESTTSVTTVTAIDTDVPAQTLTFSIIGGADESKFSINPTTGALRFNSLPDYENPVDVGLDNIYEVQVAVADNGVGYLTDVQSLSIHIIDAPENNAPVITSNGGGASATIYVAENRTSVTTVTANDIDVPAQTLTFSILGGVDNSKFSINPVTGALRFNTAPDFENPTDANRNNVYEVQVAVTDNGEGRLTDVQDLSIIVTDADENSAPVITSNGGGETASIYISENVSNVTRVTATDSDVPAQTLTFSISGGADASKFNIDPNTGELTFIITPNFEAPIDEGANNIYDVQVSVTDNGPGYLSDIQDIRITVSNEIEVSNFTINSISNATVPENSAYTSVTPAISGTPIGSVLYTISGADAAKFTINQTTGVVSMVARNFEAPVDADANNVYELNITATDADGNQDSEDWTVTVTDVIEISTFTINPIANISIPENSIYTSVTPVISGTPIGVINFTISGVDASRFTINPATGVVSMVARDFENPVDANGNNMYDLVITATDADGNYDIEDWTVTIIDVVEAAFIAINPIPNTTIPENAIYTSVTPVISGSPIGALTYTLSGIDASKFTINATTGVVTMVGRDYENPVDANSNNVYELIITATDANGNNDSEDWTVTVTDVIEIANFTINPIADVSVPENSVYTSVTPLISGIPIGGVTYTISGFDASKFSINSATGVVSMTSRDYENPVDADANNIYELTITATDDDGNKDSEDWTVRVIDVIETSFFAINSISNVVIPENSVYTSVTPVIGGVPIGSITYTLGGIDASKFTINSTTGIVSMVARDFENPVDADNNNVYELMISATDANGNNDTEDWSVTVTNVNEVSNFIINQISDYVIPENTEFTCATPEISGTPIGAVTYTLGGPDAFKLSINSSTGVVTMVARDFESPVDANSDNVYQFTIIATDKDRNSDSEDVSVTITNVVESPLKAVNDVLTVVEDNQLVANVLSNDLKYDGGNISVIDYDVYGTKYAVGSVAEIPEIGMFQISATGNMVFIPTLNYNGAVPVINYTIRNSSGVTSSATISITIIESNDAPVAVEDGTIIAINTPPIFNVLANDSDVDGQIVNLIVVTQPKFGTLEIDENTGEAIYTPNPGYNGSDSFTYKVVDNNGAVSNIATVKIEVEGNFMVEAVVDTITVEVGVPHALNPLNNDIHVSNPERLSIIQQPLNGTVSINGTTGEMTYTPDQNFIGKDVFRYSICNSNGSCDEASVFIYVEETILPPQLFTPNGNGQNDKYVIKNIENYPNSHLSVFNRWGNLVYEKRNYLNDWDGYSNVGSAIGKHALATGTYFYVLTYGENQSVSGFIYLKR